MTKKTIDIQEILHCLPHRHPFLLIDRIVDLEVGVSLLGLKNVAFNEPFFAGHFPGFPVMPGVLIIEALAQACGVLAYFSNSTASVTQSQMSLLAGIDNARFKQVVRPGDQLLLDVKLVRERQGIGKFACVARVDEQIVCSADLVSAEKR